MTVKWLSEAPRIAGAAVAIGVATAALSAAAYLSSPAHAAPKRGPDTPSGNSNDNNSNNTNSLNNNHNSFNSNSNNHTTNYIITSPDTPLAKSLYFSKYALFWIDEGNDEYTV